MRQRLLVGVAATAVAVAMFGGSAFAASGGTPASGWHIGYYTPSAIGTLSNAQAPGAGVGNVASLHFTNQANTALLVTDQKSKFGSLLGDLEGKTVSARFTISGATGAFQSYGEGTASNPCGTPATVRLYFETSNAGGFDYTHYWWSNPASQPLQNGTYTVTANVDPSQWSDWNGQFGTTVPDAFAKAAGNVTAIGLSFGGGCFFENGVGTTDGSGTFTLNAYSAG